MKKLLLSVGLIIAFGSIAAADLEHPAVGTEAWLKERAARFMIHPDEIKVEKDKSLRTKLIALVEQGTEQMRVATDKLKELNTASGPLGVRLLAEDDFCMPGEFDFVTQFSTRYFVEGVCKASIDDLIKVAVVQRMALRYYIPTAVQMVQKFAEHYKALEKRLNDEPQQNLSHAGIRIHPGREEVLKAMLADELVTFDNKVDDLWLNGGDGDASVFVACFLRKFRNIVTEGFVKSENLEMVQLFLANMFGIDKFSKELLLNPVYAEIWKRARISSDKDAYDSEFFSPFAQVVLDVLIAMNASYVAKVKVLQATAEDGADIAAFAKKTGDKIADLATGDKPKAMSGAMLCNALMMQQYWQVSLEILQECLV